ncbi:hypothetical protein VHUM_03425 [Vanrija humicola]|uniref:DUF7721 domain-containing protein n=1 Tax=Vanrija humicola TaxID=5417 RepID=A0A7D8UXD0_VANHU|nr:hypothetical protein VHUM_03425 [Vanrija humicola]
MIGTALGKAQNVGPDAQINEQAVQKDHDQAYNQGNAGSLSASAMGSAAAIQAFKSFASGGQQQQSGGGGMIEKLLGMAMSEAAKLFDKSGGAANGNKQDVMNSAGETVMKLLVQNQIQGVSAAARRVLGKQLTCPGPRRRWWWRRWCWPAPRPRDQVPQVRRTARTRHEPTHVKTRHVVRHETNRVVGCGGGCEGGGLSATERTDKLGWCNERVCGVLITSDRKRS